MHDWHETQLAVSVKRHVKWVWWEMTSAAVAAESDKSESESDNKSESESDGDQSIIQIQQLCFCEIYTLYRNAS